MNRSLILAILVFSMLVPAWADSPKDVVKAVYAGWDSIRPCSSRVELEFFKNHKDLIAPSLYQNLIKAYSYNDQMWPGSDLLFGGQVNVFGYSVQAEKIDQDSATVEVFVRLGLDRNRSQVRGSRVHLARSAQGWQITDLDRGNRLLSETVKAYLSYQTH